MRRLCLLVLLSVSWSIVLAGIIKAPKGTGLKLRRRPRSIDLNSAHVLLTETRLSSDVEPLSYKLEIQPYFDESIFKGKVNTKVLFNNNLTQITLHVDHNLEILEVKAWLQKNVEEKQVPVPISNLNRDAKRPLYTIELASIMEGHTKGELEIDFEGKLETDSAEGIFKTNYINDAGQDSYLVATQLRQNNARKVFPCFDEPAFKVPFELSVLRPKTMHVIANTPLLKSENIPGEPFSVMDQFETTLKMSTFSVGFIISDLKELKNETVKIADAVGNNLVIRVWARNDFAPALAGVGEKIERAFKEASNFWQHHLPMTKIDIVALPNYQGVKPVDAWGLIIFKESDLASKGYFLIAQELHYQWFGILTSPSWWSEAHLNKALTGYLAASTALKIDNGSELDGKWPMTILYSLYYEFSKRYPHSRITGMKQETASSKIELLFRMLNYTIGISAFENGMRTFIKEKALSTFTGNDIWDALTESGKKEKRLHNGIKLSDVAETWISKNRLPIVTVNRHYSARTAVFTQSVYLRERPHDVPGQDKMTWSIPMVVVSQSNLDFVNYPLLTWLYNTKQVTLFDLPPNDGFIIANPEEIGPFPVNYDLVNWNMLARYLATDNRLKIPVLTRAKLLHDAWNLAYAGELNCATALNMTLFLKRERDHLVWDPVFTMIDHIGRHIDSSEVHRKFEKYVRSLLTPVYEELVIRETEDEESWKTNLRSMCKTFLCKVGYKPCIAEAQTMFKKWMESDTPDEGNPVPNQYICPVFKWGTKDEWEFGLQRIINFPSTRKPSERTYLLKTLAGCPITQWKIQRLLNLTIIEENGNFTENDIYLIFSMLTGGSRGYTTLFNFLVGNWDIIKSRFENKTNLWYNILSSSTSMFTTQEGLDKVTKLYVDKQGEFGSGEHIIEKSLKIIREETKWSDENLPVIEKWLDNYLISNIMENNKFIEYNVGD